MTRHFIALLMAALLGTGTAVAEEWRRFTHPELDFTIELPVESFALIEDGDPQRLRLQQADGEAQIEVFGLTNPEPLSVRAFRDLVEAADPTRRITYRAGGSNWFVLSGYYGEPGGDELIFYAKFIVDRSGRAVAAFEISYPRDEKRRFDALVTRIEKSLTRPGAAG